MKINLPNSEFEFQNKNYTKKVEIDQITIMFNQEHVKYSIRLLHFEVIVETETLVSAGILAPKDMGEIDLFDADYSTAINAINSGNLNQYLETKTLELNLNGFFN